MSQEKNSIAWDSWWPKKLLKKKVSFFRVFLRFFITILLAWILVLIVDIFFFYKTNKIYFLNQQTSFKILSLNISNNLKDNNLIWLEENLLKIKSKELEINTKLWEYKKRFLFRIFGISNFIWRIEEFFSLLVPVSEELFNLQKNFDIFISWKIWKTNPVKQMNVSLEKLIFLLKNIEEHINSFDILFIWKQFNINIDNLLNNIGLIRNTLIDVNKYSDLVLKLTWEDWPQTLALLFQNSNELRPTGWFIWSFMIVKFNNWKIMSYRIQDIYKYDWQITKYYEPPYEWEKLVWEKSWSLRDSNLSPDLEVSARNFNDFYEKSWWETIDNFIFIDQTLIADFLDILGPIHLNNYGIDINSDNFDFVMQFFIEWAKKNAFVSPKLILINDFYRAFLDKAKLCFTKDNLPCIARFNDIKYDIFDNKNLQITSINSWNKKLIEDLWFNWKFPSDDFVAPVFISISWNKSDKFVKTFFALEKKSEYEFTFNVSRTHSWPEKYEKKWQFLINTFDSWIPRDLLKDILWFWWNRSVLQFYLPHDFSLLFSQSSIIRDWKLEELDINPRGWQKGNLAIYEFELPIIYPDQKIELVLHFKSQKRIENDISIWKQPWLIVN